MRACSFTDKKVKREKEEKNLALGVKRKQLKRKKDRGLDRATDGEATANNGAKEGNISERFFGGGLSFLFIYVL